MLSQDSTALKPLKSISVFILILLIAALQLPVTALAVSPDARKITVLELENLERRPLEGVLNTLENNGFDAITVREDVFRRQDSIDAPLVVPMSRNIDAATLATLKAFVDAGGRLVLIPPDSYPNISTNKLFQLIGVSVTGTTFTPEPLSLHWGGKDIPAEPANRLPAGSNILTIVPGSGVRILATWGSDYPAVVSTDKGTVLNWPWGRELTAAVNIEALKSVLPIGQTVQLPNTAPKTTSSQSAAAKRRAEVARLAKLSTVPVDKNAVNKPAKPVTPISPLVNPNPPLVPIPGAPSPIPVATATPNPFNGTSTTSTGLAPQTSPFNASSVTSSTTTQTPRSTSNGSVPKSGKLPAGTEEDEVLRNILGQTPSGQTGTPQPGGQSVASTTGATKRPYSFLDVDPASLAPEFDYGVYSSGMRTLDEYKARTRDALETSRQLGMNFPQQQVEALLNQSDESKRQFEQLYLNGQTQAGLDAYDKARKLSLQAVALTTASPKVEGRAIWLDRGTIIGAGSEPEVKKLMQRLSQAGINIVYFETVNAGFPIYPSKLTRQNPMVNGWDPLKAAIEEGHRLGMEVHAWVWCFAVGNRRHNELIGQGQDYPGPVLTDDGLMSEALRNRGGGLEVDSKQMEYWLSPASPKGRTFLLDLYKEIVSNYNVDGVNLDYIRYPFQSSGRRMGYEQAGRDGFYRSTGLSLDDMDDYKMRLWIAWKTYQVTSFVQQVSETLRAVKPDIKISADVFPMKRESRIVAIQQDWETWIDNGWIDVLNPMSYTSDPDKLQSIFDYVRRSPQKHVVIYPGIALKSLDAGELVVQLEALRQKGSMGATLFAGAQLDAEKAGMLGTGPYKDHTTVPPHRDVVKSLQLILSDYGQKFGRLQSNGSLTAVSPPLVQAIQTSLSQLGSTLTGVTLGVNTGASQVTRLQEAQKQLKALKASSNTWTAQERFIHPYRAQYFEKNMLLLDNLLGYLIDRSNVYLPATAETAVAPSTDASGTPGYTLAPSTSTDPDSAFEAP